MTPAGGDPVREGAFAATFALINATVPPPAERPTDYPQRALNFAQRHADRYSLAVGGGIQPTALTLTELADTAAYHFDWRLPLEFPDVVEAGRVQALLQVDAAVPGHDSGYWPRHPDHDAVGG